MNDRAPTVRRLRHDLFALFNHHPAADALRITSWMCLLPPSVLSSSCPHAHETKMIADRRTPVLKAEQLRWAVQPGHRPVLLDGAGDRTTAATEPRVTCSRPSDTGAAGRVQRGTSPNPSNSCPRRATSHTGGRSHAAPHPIVRGDLVDRRHRLRRRMLTFIHSGCTQYPIGFDEYGPRHSIPTNQCFAAHNPATGTNVWSSPESGSTDFRLEHPISILGRTADRQVGTRSAELRSYPTFGCDRFPIIFVLWPDGYTIEKEGAIIDILDTDGRVVARLGDTIETTGGAGTDNSVERAQACTRDPLWGMQSPVTIVAASGPSTR